MVYVWQVSGEKLLEVSDEQLTDAAALKQLLQSHCGVAPFRQRLLCKEAISRTLSGSKKQRFQLETLKLSLSYSERLNFRCLNIPQCFGEVRTNMPRGLGLGVPKP